MSMNKMLCTLGKFDIPIVQKQSPFQVDLLDSNVIVFGASMSGKSTFLKTLINILHKRYNEKTEQIFVLDFGGALSEYKRFPLVAAYFDNSNEEYVKRVFKILDNILKANVKSLNGKNYRDADEQPIHTTFIIDNLNAFLDEPRYSAYQDKFAKLCRDGLSKGISIVVTAVETKGLGSLMGIFRQKIAFEMPQDKYAEIFNEKVGQIGNNPGHGFANVTVKLEDVTGAFRMNQPYEVQCRLPYGPECKNNIDTPESFEQKLQRKYHYDGSVFGRCVKKYQTFPKELTDESFLRLKQEPAVSDRDSVIPVSVGLDYVDFFPVTVDLAQSHVLAIYGKKEFGKTNLLRLLLKGFTQQKKDARIVFFDDGRNQLKEIYERYQNTLECQYINGFAEEQIVLAEVAGKGTLIKSAPAEPKVKKLSPIQRFYLYLHNNYADISQNILGEMFGLGELERKRIATGQERPETPFTIFVIQSKLAYLNTVESKHFIEKVLPKMAAVAEDKGYLFIFSDVQKINDMEANTIFNNMVSTAFLLDNIAEFAGERGQKTVFGSMDVKTLKEDYARCELGDGYCYDIEADRLVKTKFIKFKED